jgi:hypothetical protein
VALLPLFEFCCYHTRRNILFLLLFPTLSCFECLANPCLILVNSYLENTWERTGLYPRGILGTKYQLQFLMTYHYWDLGSKTWLVCLGALLVFFTKKTSRFNFIFISVYLGLMLLTETFYDQYLLILIPFFVILNYADTVQQTSYLDNLGFCFS